MLANDSQSLVMDSYGFAVRHDTSSNRFYATIVPYLVSRCRVFAPDLPEDLHYDVAHEVLLLLMKRIGKFNDKRGSFKTFINFLVRDSIKTVRASFAAPGFKTRPRNDPKMDKETSEAVADGYQKAEAVLKPPEQSIEDYADVIIDPVGMDELVEMRFTVESAFNAATGPVADYWIELFVDEKPLQEVAENAGISRFKLSRSISKYRDALLAA